MNRSLVGPLGNVVLAILLSAGSTHAEPLREEGSTPPAPAPVFVGPTQLSEVSRARLQAAARNPALPDWQRDCMLGIASNPRASSDARSGAYPPGPASVTTVVDGIWTTDPQPTPREEGTAVYDPVRDRLLVFGGSQLPTDTEIWALNLAGQPQWSKFDVFSSPLGPGTRIGHSLVYDPLRDRILLFGGTFNGFPRNDIWELPLTETSTWTRLLPSGVKPPSRWRHAAVYDPVRDRLVIFGGASNQADMFNDLWALPLSGSLAWTPIMPAGASPEPRYGPSMTFDPVRDQLIMIAGVGRPNGVTTALNDVWTIPLAGPATWSTMAPSGNPPPGRSDHGAIYDPDLDRVVVFGGTRISLYFNDTWQLTLSGTPAWGALSFNSPLPESRAQGSCFYDPVRARMVIYGGYGTGSLLNDAWALPMAVGAEWQPVRVVPGPRSGHSAVLDPVRRRMLVFGNFVQSDVWSLSLDGTHSWLPLVCEGPLPPARLYHSAIYDPVRDRMLVFGGSSNARTVNDLWSLDLSGVPTWSPLVATGSPPSPRMLHSAMYDPAGDRMLLFGGADVTTNGQLFQLSLAGTPHWSLVVPLGSPPPPRREHSAIHDPVGGRMIIFGGVADGSSAAYSDVWALTLSGVMTWQQVVPGGELVEGRSAHTAVCDSRRNRMLVTAGILGPNVVYETSELDLAGAGTWSSLTRTGTQPGPRLSHSAVYDPIRDELLLFGGHDGNASLNDLWVMKFAGDVGVPPRTTGTGGVRLSQAYPNPARGPASIEFGLPHEGPATLRLFDTNGRLVRIWEFGSVSAGSHSIRWDGRGADGGPVRPGLYFYELRTAEASISRRVVLTR